jgi:hypothetical protein
MTENNKINDHNNALHFRWCGFLLSGDAAGNIRTEFARQKRQQPDLTRMGTCG